MTREEAIRFLENITIYQQPDSNYRKALDLAIKALKQEPCEDCDYKEWLKGEVEPFINKPCVSSGVCEHDKQKVLDKIRAEIQENINYNEKMNYQGIVAGLLLTLDIIDKCKAESEDKE